MTDTPCPRSKRVDHPDRHTWRFDGDDPYIKCVFCQEERDALTGRIVVASPYTPRTPESST